MDSNSVFQPHSGNLFLAKTLGKRPEPHSDGLIAGIIVRCYAATNEIIPNELQIVSSYSAKNKAMNQPLSGKTIARANRVAPGKVCGRIIDYYGVFRNLKKALAAYATGEEETDEKSDKPKVGDLPVEEKEKLFDLLKQAIQEADDFCLPLDIKLDLVLVSGDIFEEVGLFESFADRLLAYNSGSLSVENYFDDLIDFSKELRKEEERHIRENLTTDELELFDLIRQTNKDLTKKEEQIVKLAAN